MNAFRACTLLFACLVMCIAHGAWADDRVFRMVYADYRPYSWEQDGQAHGLEVEVADELLVRRLHLNVEHNILPWERAQQYVKSGRADALISTANSERASYAWSTSAPVCYWQMSAFARRDDVRIKALDGVDALKPFALGTELGNRWLPAHLPNANIQFVESVVQLPKLLIASRIDLIADDSMVIRDVLASLPEQTQIIEYPLPSTRSPMYFMLSKQSGFADLRSKIDAAMADMTRDGTLQKIQQRYHQTAP